MRAGSNTLRIGRSIFAMRIAQVAGRSFKLADFQCTVSARWIVRLNELPLVGHHENAAVRTIRSAQSAADAVILDDDLEMLAAMNGIHRAAHHAMRIEAGAARSGDD